jgi:GT2 family glycosyltransferase
MTTVSFVIVTHNSATALGTTLPALGGQLAAGDELIVVDNESSDGTAERARELVPGATVIESGGNLGYGGGNNLGASSAKGELLVFLNPDVTAQPGFRDAIAAPADDGSGWGAWQGLVTAESGKVVNTRGGVIHFTALAWAGGAGEALPSGPPPEPGFVSGACLAIPRASFQALGGFSEEFFLYHEDVDLSLRVRLAGGRLGVAAGAVVDHHYEFDKGPAKWRYLERNRWATLIRTYPAALLTLVFPALIATDLALWPIALVGGWGRQRLLALFDFLRSLPRLIGERRVIQRDRRIGSREFAAALTPALDSPYLGRASRSRALAVVLRGYWSVVLRLLG